MLPLILFNAKDAKSLIIYHGSFIGEYAAGWLFLNAKDAKYAKVAKKIFWVFALPNVVNFMAKTLENNMEQSPKYISS